MGVLILEGGKSALDSWRLIVKRKTYSLVLDLLSLAALESSAMTLVLEALGSNQTLDLGSLGVWGLALTLGLNLAADDVLADLNSHIVNSVTYEVV